MSRTVGENRALGLSPNCPLPEGVFFAASPSLAADRGGTGQGGEHRVPPPQNGKWGLPSLPPQWESKDPKVMVRRPQNPSVLTSGNPDCHGAGGDSAQPRGLGGHKRGLHTPLHTPIPMIQGFLPSTTKKETGAGIGSAPPKLRQKRQGEKGGLRGSPMGLGGPGRVSGVLRITARG